MGKLLSDEQIAQYNKDGFFAPARVMSADDTLALTLAPYRRRRFLSNE